LKRVLVKNRHIKKIAGKEWSNSTLWGKKITSIRAPKDMHVPLLNCRSSVRGRKGGGRGKKSKKREENPTDDAR